MAQSGKHRSGFSLIELVIVVVIIGIIAAIAVPRLSRGAAGASDSALAGDLKVLRTALDMYATEHGGTYPTQAQITAGVLTGYSDDSGTYSATKTTTAIYGPYLRAVPTLPVGANKGSTGVAAAAAAGVGWLYTPTGTPPSSYTLTASTTTETDAKGTLYSGY
jgi:general secretion pathway protein G